MVKTGIITGRTLQKNRDGTGNRIMLQVEMTNPDDIQTVELYAPGGQDVNPPDGSRVVIIEIAPTYKIAIVADDGIEPSMLDGEQKLYATDGISILSFINLLTDGNIELNGNADFAVRFAALNTALQTFVIAINAVLATKADASGTPGALTLDITGAKVNEVKVP